MVSLEESNVGETHGGRGLVASSNVAESFSEARSVGLADTPVSRSSGEASFLLLRVES